MDFWDGVITQEKGSENKVKWKKRYLELQASRGSYIYLLVYKPTYKKKKTQVPLMKFTLTDETSSIFVGPTIKNKYTFDIGVRIGKLFMRYRFGLETEELRNKWIYEVVNSFYTNPFTSESKYFLACIAMSLEIEALNYASDFLVIYILSPTAEILIKEIPPNWTGFHPGKFCGPRFSLRHAYTRNYTFGIRSLGISLEFPIKFTRL